MLIIPPPCLLPPHVLCPAGLLFPLFLLQDTVNTLSDLLGLSQRLFPLLLRKTQGPCVHSVFRDANQRPRCKQRGINLAALQRRKCLSDILVFDPRGIRQMCMQACPLDSLLAGIKISIHYADCQFNCHTASTGSLV